MDASRLALTVAVLLIAFGIGRFVLATAGRAGDGMATLFVPPDRTLGWPLGVQESDEPWAWQAPPPNAAAPAPDDDGGLDDPPGEPALWIDPPRGSFVVPVDRVTPVRHGVRPH
jgi:hypothetical protein